MYVNVKEAKLLPNLIPRPSSLAHETQGGKRICVGMRGTTAT